MLADRQCFLCICGVFHAVAEVLSVFWLHDVLVFDKKHSSADLLSSFDICFYLAGGGRKNFPQKANLKSEKTVVWIFLYTFAK